MNVACQSRSTFVSFNYQNDFSFSLTDLKQCSNMFDMSTRGLHPYSLHEAMYNECGGPSGVQLLPFIAPLPISHSENTITWREKQGSEEE